MDIINIYLNKYSINDSRRKKGNHNKVDENEK